MPPDYPEPPDTAPCLTSLERTVVALGLRDPLRSVPRPRRWFDWTDRAEHLHLTDPRLEALRRFVVLLRHDRAADEMTITAGFSPAQIREAQALVALHRGA